ncbi:hypothetical protein SISSUDRAFT_1061063 [Sistotremastrum suecicum HHB10207 ss-3]|uniref:Uncharacterized protein n=1 Tax=Sistotremastrum suecicum HHB10207 ss-3 TaxID=1314776 RepID=A0A166EH63_9AGAM|nr:hypothetical protein SISSUDRAFT_1061063 [Sistotremastrum suecicum HHB10207 ss-3]
MCAADKVDRVDDYRYHTSDETRDRAKRYLKHLDMLQSRLSAWSMPPRPSRPVSPWRTLWAPRTWFAPAAPSEDVPIKAVTFAPSHAAIEMEGIPERHHLP